MDQGILPTLPPRLAGAAARAAGRRRGRLLGLVTLCLVVGALAGAATGQAGAGIEPALTHLLRLMALLKLATVLGATWLVDWRLRRPAGRRFRVGYPAALGLMAAAPGLIWWAAPVAAGAVAFHAGLLLLLVLALGDDAALPAPRRTVERRFTPN